MRRDEHYNRAPGCREAAIAAGWADLNSRGGSCLWRSQCGHMASHYRYHPVHGDVPACKCCGTEAARERLELPKST